jgi:hypothetical protein
MLTSTNKKFLKGVKTKPDFHVLLCAFIGMADHKIAN